MTQDWPATPAAWQEAARAALDPAAWAYYSGGAGDETTLADNVAAWRRWALRPRVLVDVSAVDPSVPLLGRQLPHPVVVAPTAFQPGAHPDGEIGMARACAATGATYCLSTSAGTTPADLAAGAPGAERWFQLYLRGSISDGIRALREVADLGYTAVLLTVDLPVLGVRDRERATPWSPDATLPTVAASGKLLEPLTFAGLEQLASACRVPLLVKGVLDPGDASRCVAAGAAGVVVSNHGGRQLDSVLATADVLAQVVDAVAGAVPVLVDGGIRRGSDVAVALSLGAAAVLVGRLPLWGLAVGGEAGATAVLAALVEEFRVALALLGVPSAADLGRDQVVAAPWR